MSTTSEDSPFRKRNAPAQAAKNRLYKKRGGDDEAAKAEAGRVTKGKKEITYRIASDSSIYQFTTTSDLS